MSGPGREQRAWPGISSPDGLPDCEYCSWAWLEPHGRMEVKFLNAICPKYGHRAAGIALAQQVTEGAERGRPELHPPGSSRPGQRAATVGATLSTGRYLPVPGKSGASSK